MKLKRVLSLCLAAATVATCSSVVSAADENTTSFGTPISLTTGAEVEELTAGDFVAIPVDVTTSTGTLTSWTPRVVLSDAIDVDIYATTTADEAGATASTDKKIGSINLTMDGTVTSYNTVNGTIAK